MGGLWSSRVGTVLHGQVQHGGTSLRRSIELALGKQNPMPESRSYQRFRSRLEYLEQHMQVVDLCIRLALDATKASPPDQTILGALGVEHARYGRLRHPVGEGPRLFNFSRSQNFEHAIVALYRYFGEYLRGVLEEMYSKDPLAIVGKVQGAALQFHELVELGSYEAVTARMVDITFRRLEDERSTTKMLDRLLSHTRVQISDDVRTSALCYLEMRHLFIHNNGRCDGVFAKHHGAKFGVVSGDPLPTDYRTVCAAIAAVTKLLHAIDADLLRTKLVPLRTLGSSTTQQPNGAKAVPAAMRQRRLAR